MKIVLNPDYQSLNEFVSGLPERFAGVEGVTIYKGRNVLKRFDSDGFRLVVKRFKRPFLLNRIIYSFFRKSKACRSYEHSLVLKRLGFGVATPVAYLEIKRNGLLTDSYYVSLNLDGMGETREYMASCLPEHHAFRQAFALFAAHLHQAGILHVDFSPGNVLVKPDGESYQFALVDVNRMRFLRHIHFRLACRNMARLATSREALDEIARIYATQRGWDKERTARLMNRYSDRFFTNYAFRLGNKKWIREGKSRLFPASMIYRLCGWMGRCPLLPGPWRKSCEKKLDFIYETYIAPFDFRQTLKRRCPLTRWS